MAKQQVPAQLRALLPAQINAQDFNDNQAWVMGRYTALHDACNNGKICRHTAKRFHQCETRAMRCAGTPRALWHS